MLDYFLMDSNSLFGIANCGGNYTNQENGIIQTPNYPNNYPAVMQTCNWFIIVQTGSKILLHFDQFLIEGEPLSRGCSGGVVRVWPDIDQRPIELCGEKLADDQKQYVSESNVLRIAFYTAQKSVGAQGFSAIWTEIEMPSEKFDSNRNSGSSSCSSSTTAITYPMNGESLLASNAIQSSTFQCRTKGYCIAEKLRCNGIKNCGFDDDSDERDCFKEITINLIELVGGMTGLLLFIFFMIGILCLTMVMVLTWVRKSKIKKKNGDQLSEKNCQHYLNHSAANSLTNFYHTDPPNDTTVPSQRLIDSMATPSPLNGPIGTGTIPTIRNVCWSSGNTGSTESAHHRILENNPDPLFSGENEEGSESPVPPPPPPPINRSLLNLNQPSILNYHCNDNDTFKSFPHSQTHLKNLIGFDRSNRSASNNLPQFVGSQTIGRQNSSRASTFTPIYPYSTFNGKQYR
ncbi:CUB domain-containing protein 10 [Sarcoptes scabiei]|uniref:CUB domain-containing protein 10 n=1 Tax=Sarcoptes scabiei TaxID=52283 RepID=A0A132A192_SARSC|nr:CUB domain-containing protein 10 [Sarcoptes scabiei]